MNNLKITHATALYLTHVIKAFALSAVGIFLPIYIYDLSKNTVLFSLPEVTNGVLWVLLYYIVQAIFVLLGIALLAKMSPTFVRSITLGFLFLAGAIVLWIASTTNIYLLFFGAALVGLNIGFFWIPFHIFFIKYMGGEKHKYGKTLGKREFYVNIAQASAPFFAGLIIYFFGYNALFIATISFVLIGWIPFSIGFDNNTKITVDIKKVINNYIRNKKLKSTTQSMAAISLENYVNMAFWPLILMFALQNVVLIGSISTISIVVSAIAALFVGRALDKIGDKKIHKIGVAVNTVNHLLKAFVKVPWAMYALDIMHRLNYSAYILPFNDAVYKKAYHSDITEFVFYRELVFKIYTLVILVLLIPFVIFVPYWSLIFIVPAIASLYTFKIHDLSEY